MASQTDQIVRGLNAQREAFKAFLVARVGSESEAEDILQNGLVKALRHADELADIEKSTAWFYRLLRNAVVDYYRHRAAERGRDAVLATTAAVLDENAAPPAWEAQVCACLAHVIDTLDERQAALLRRVDLEGESVQSAARALHVTPNHASVLLLRARRSLRAKLEAFCGACADGACLDCQCSPVDEKNETV